MGQTAADDHAHGTTACGRSEVQVSGPLLVVDIGTSGVRASVVHADATVTAVHYRRALPDSPAPGLVEFDPLALAEAARGVARAALAEGGPVAAVGITNQRASTVVWDRATGEPVGPGLGWQDLRTVGDCLVWQAEGLHFAPNETATKAAHLLDAADPDRTRDLCVGTIDTWIAWQLSEGALHVTDASNAAVTGMRLPDGSDWDDKVLDALRIRRSTLARVVDSTGTVGTATALAGAPPIASLVGDQQASLIGQGCVRPGMAKITFGTGGMLDVCLGSERPAFTRQGDQGTFPIVAWREGGAVTWGVEAVMLAAGTNVEWLRDDLGIIDTAEASGEVAAACDSTDGVMYVPALLGLGTPRWDYGARGTLLGITRGTGRRPARAGRAGGGGAPGRRPGRGGGGRHRAGPRPAAGRRGHDRQRHVPAGGGRRHPAPRRGVARARGHDARRGLPRRDGRGDLVGMGRRGRHVATAGGRGAGPRAGPGALARGAGTRRGLGAGPHGDHVLTAPENRPDGRRRIGGDDTRGGRRRPEEGAKLMARSRRTLGILAGVTAVVLVIVGVGAWYFFIRDDAPEEASIETAGETLDEASGTGDEAAAGDGSFEGSWAVDDSVGTFDDFSGTWAGYRFDEELASIGTNTAVGRTPDVTGTMTVAGNEVTAVDVEVDLTTLQSDSGTRDGALRSRGLQSDSFPTATFSLTEPVALPEGLGEGGTAAATATGELTIHGTTNEVSVEVDVDLSGSTAAVVGQAPVLLSDYGIDPPTGFSVLSIQDQGTFEFQIFFTRQ